MRTVFGLLVVLVVVGCGARPEPALPQHGQQQQQDPALAGAAIDSFGPADSWPAAKPKSQYGGGASPGKRVVAQGESPRAARPELKREETPRGPVADPENTPPDPGRAPRMEVSLSTMTKAGSTIECVPQSIPAELAARSGGACHFDHTNSPESWVRGYGSFDKSTRDLRAHLHVETDAMHAGPCGTLQVWLTDENNQWLATIKSEGMVCIGGKPPGKAIWTDRVWRMPVSQAVADRARHVTVEVQRPENKFQIWSISMDQVSDAVQAVGEIAAAFGG